MPFDPSKITLEADVMSFIRRYDAHCKRVLSNRMVLAHLLRATMEEFGDIDAEVIATRYIEGIPGQENHTPRIQGLRNERDNPNRNSNFFDVIFHALKPGTGEPIPIIINVEAQSDSYPGYDLTDRGVFYLGCMIADQKDTLSSRRIDTTNCARSALSGYVPTRRKIWPTPLSATRLISMLF